MKKSVAISEMLSGRKNFLIDLYEILDLDNSVILRACAINGDVVYNGKLYQAMPVSRDKTKKTVDKRSSTLELTLADVNKWFLSRIFAGQEFRNRRVVVTTVIYPNSVDKVITRFTPTPIEYKGLGQTEVRKIVFAGRVDAVIATQKDVKIGLVNKLNDYKGITQKFAPMCPLTFGEGLCEADHGYITDVTSYDNEEGSNQVNLGPINLPITGYQYGILTIGYESRQVANIKTDAYGDTIVTVTIPFLQNTQKQHFEISKGCTYVAATCMPSMISGNYNFRGFPLVNILESRYI